MDWDTCYMKKHLVSLRECLLFVCRKDGYEHMSKTDTESTYKRNKKKSGIIGTIALLSVLLGIVAYFFNPLIGAGLVAAGAILIFAAPKKKTDEIEKPALKEILGEKIKQVEFEQDLSIPDKFLKKGIVQPYWEKSKGSNLITGKYRDIPIRFSNIVLTVEQYSQLSKRLTDKTVFSGFALMIERGRSLQGEVRVKKERPDRSLEEQTTAGYAADSRLMQINEDTAGEASLILTPGFETDFLSKYKDKEVYLVSCENWSLLAFESDRSLFGSRGATLEEYKENCRKDLAFILEVFDLFIDKTELYH